VIVSATDVGRWMSMWSDQGARAIFGIWGWP
jgi:hypothetical protein